MRLPEIQLVVTDKGGPSASKQGNLVNMSLLDPIVVPEVENESKNLMNETDLRRSQRISLTYHEKT